MQKSFKSIISISILLILLILFFSNSDLEYQQQKDSQLIKKHNMRKQQQQESQQQNHKFYGEGRSDCVKTCEEAGGVNCGIVIKNCCQKGKCTDHTVFNYQLSQTCQQYLAIQSCTEP